MGTPQSKTEASILTPPTEGLSVKADSTLNYLLIGTAGNGKSSSGNALVGETVFKSYNKTTAGTKFIWRYASRRFGKDLCVVDTPGLNDTERMNSKIENARFAKQLMTKAFQLCHEGFDALLIVFNVTSKFGYEDRKLCHLLSEICGDDMFDHTILIFTHGDKFDSEHQISDSFTSQAFFKSWCKQQAGDLGELLKKCQYRAVLFHNTDTYGSHRDVELLALENEMNKISNKMGRYTQLLFQGNEDRRKYLILNNYLSELEQEINVKLLSLEKELQLIESDGETITDKAKDVQEAIDKHGSNFLNLTTLKESLDHLQNNFRFQTSYQDRLHLISKTQELIDGNVLFELKSLSDVIDKFRNLKKHKEQLKSQAKALARYIDEEDLGTNKLDDLKEKVKRFLHEFD